MQHALIQKLDSFEPLSDADRAALTYLVPEIRMVGPRTDLIREGDNPEDVHLILDGFACRYKILPSGRRQIMAYLVPGDFCDLNVFILDAMDHNIGTTSTCQVVDIPRRDIETIMAHHPAITRAFWWCSLVDAAVLREWLVNLGGRQANERIAHLFCEMLMRLDVVGRVSNNSFTFPFTQEDIADSMGLSSVHVNRVLRDLRELGLVTLKGRVLSVLDVEGLRAYCGFTANYLHLTNTRWGDRRRLRWPGSLQGT